MGGAIVTLYTLREKPTVAGLVLSAAALEADVFFGKKLATRAIAAALPSAPIFQLDVDDFSRDPAVVQAAKDDRFVYQDAAPARTAKELLSAMAEIDRRMKEMTVPLLLLHGKADKVTPPQGTIDLNERASSRDKTLILYDGLYHDLLHEPEHAKVEADITRWLVERAPRAAAGSNGP
jgi:alpha-beta hydrolase superfamily lysophospholipase